MRLVSLSIAASLAFGLNAAAQDIATHQHDSDGTRNIGHAENHDWYKELLRRLRPHVRHRPRRPRSAAARLRHIRLLQARLRPALPPHKRSADNTPGAPPHSECHRPRLHLRPRRPRHPRQRLRRQVSLLDELHRPVQRQVRRPVQHQAQRPAQARRHQPSTVRRAPPRYPAGRRSSADSRRPAHQTQHRPAACRTRRLRLRRRSNVRRPSPLRYRASRRLRWH